MLTQEKKLQINLLCHNRERFAYTRKSISELQQIKNKQQIFVVICFTEEQDSNIWSQVINDLEQSGISADMKIIGPGEDNYLKKVEYLSNTSIEYSCSMDDDIFIRRELWDYIIENLDVLNDEENILISPLISNGIPSVDLFIEDFFNEQEKREMRQIFSKTKIENFWGANYENLNRIRDEWDFSFYEDVAKVDHFYKGIHPIRVSIEGHRKMAELICRDPHSFFENQDYYLEKRKFPYFCNSFYFIKTETWKKILSDKSLFRDPYDEVPLNIYTEMNDLKLVFVRNGFCLHMAYNTINLETPGIQREIEEYYKINFLEKL